MTRKTKQTPGRQFPNWIQAIVQAHPNSPLPERYRKWSAISAISGALGRKCWYDWGPYVVYPHQYIVLVGPRGIGKTASMILPLSTCFHKLAVPAGAKEPTEKDPDGAGWQWDWEGFGLKNPLRYLIGRVTTEQLVIDLAQAEIEDQLALLWTIWLCAPS